jgi:hypothetical protein
LVVGAFGESIMGQIYYYDTGSSSWLPIQVGAQGPAGVISQSTAPSNTSSLWLDTSSTAVAPGLGAAGKNFIINGGMEINQRGYSGTPSATTNTYTLDRWCAYITSANVAFAQSSSSPPTGFRYFQTVTTSSTTSTTWYLAQSLETNNVVPLQGQTVTLSFWYKMPTNFTNAVNVGVNYSTGTDANLTNAGTSAFSNALTNNSAWTYYQTTFVVSSTATSLAVQFSSATNVVNGAQFNVTGVQLEINPIATVFSRAGGTYQGELAQCQRYYFAQPNFYTPAASGGFSGNSYGQTLFFPVPLRITPAYTAFTFYTGSNYTGTAGSITGYATGTAISLSLSAVSGGGQYTIMSNCVEFYSQGTTVTLLQGSYTVTAEL